MMRRTGINIGFFSLFIAIPLLGCKSTLPSTSETRTTTISSTDDLCAMTGPVKGTTDEPALSFEALNTNTAPSSPIDNGAFTIPAGAGLPSHRFEGRLDLHDEHLSQIDNHFTEWWLPDGQDASTIPDFDYQFVQCGDTLLPIQRGRILTDNPYWDLLLQPGRVWSTPFDEGMSRASFPFALTMKAENCVQNGLMTFLYDDDSVSDVRWQITQETCHFHEFDMWGQSAATYHPAAIPQSTQVINSHKEQIENSFPTRPWEDLATQYGLDLTQLDSEITLDNLTTRGVLVEGTLYIDRCRSRFGDYPYCDEMVLPSFSLAKTSFISLAMMAIAQEFGPEIYDVKLSELLPKETNSATDDWSSVTMRHLVDMTTGHFRYANQDDDYMGNFYSEYDLASRLESALLFPYETPPGEQVVYLTPNSQISAAALDVYLTNQNAFPSDAYDYVVDRVFEPIGMPPEYFTTLRTHQDGVPNNGTAFGGYGMTLTPQGTAKLSKFLLEGGQLNGQQLLHSESLAIGLFQTEERGAPMNYYDWYYLRGFWGNTANFSCQPTIPYMFGVSGITVALFPNDVVYFSYTDSQEYPVNSIVDQINKIKPLCE
jgi:CubicO group peptidase (beta-lactamase class C family)